VRAVTDRKSLDTNHLTLSVANGAIVALRARLDPPMMNTHDPVRSC